MPVSLKFFNIDYYNYNRKISLSDKPELYIFGVIILCFNKCIHCIMNIYILKYMNYEHIKTYNMVKIHKTFLS